MANKINRNYSINFVTNTITLSKDFEKKTRVHDSDANVELRLLQEEYPNMTIVRKTVTTRKKKVKKQWHMSYEAMDKYMRCFPDYLKYRLAFERVQEASKVQPNPYHFVEKWFEKTFPNYKEVPTIDAAGNITYATADEAAQQNNEAA